MGCRQRVDLLGVKDGVAFHEGDFFLNIRPLVVCRGFLEGAGIHDQSPLLPFADVPAKHRRLFEGQLDRADIILFHCRRPEHEDVHASVGNTHPSQWSRYRPRNMRRLPRLQPRLYALLKGGNDLVGNAAVNVVFFTQVAPLYLPVLRLMWPTTDSDKKGGESISLI